MRDEQANTAGDTFGLINKDAARAASREKTWAECGIEEKVERLRQQLGMARDMGQYIAETAASAKRTAENHQHGPQGDVLVPVQRHGGEGGQIGKGFDPLR